jgi:hypothetical protein
VALPLLLGFVGDVTAEEQPLLRERIEAMRGRYGEIIVRFG